MSLLNKFQPMKIILACVLACCSLVVYADDLDVLPSRYHLTPVQVHTELIFMGTLLLDYSQTRDIKNHAGMYEINHILGQHPSDAKIRNYFLAVGVGHYLVTKALPNEYRPYWQWGWIGIELLTIAHNRQIGLQFKF
jgi:hypothetical protein